MLQKKRKRSGNKGQTATATKKRRTRAATVATKCSENQPIRGNFNLKWAFQK